MIEDKASGTQLIQELLQAGVYEVTKHQSRGDTVMRAHAQSATIENGFVFVPSNAAWIVEYLHELETFPKGRSDDPVVSTSQALEWIKDLQDSPFFHQYIMQRPAMRNGEKVL